MVPIQYSLMGSIVSTFASVTPTARVHQAYINHSDLSKGQIAHETTLFPTAFHFTCNKIQSPYLGQSTLPELTLVFPFLQEIEKYYLQEILLFLCLKAFSLFFK